MTFLFGDSFNTVDDAYEEMRWDDMLSAAGVAYASGYGSDGDWGMRLSASTIYYIQKNLSSSETTLIVGGRYKLASLSSTSEFLSFYDSSTLQCELRAMADGSLAFYRGTSTQIGVSDTGLVSADTWYFIEAKVTFDNTTGSVEIKLDGVTKINESPVDTVSSANEQVTNIRLYSNGGLTYADDFYICNTSGTECNNFLGDIKIKPYYAASDGTYTQFTPSSGSDHYAMVDDDPLADANTYNESSTVGHRDSCGLDTYSETGTVHVVQVIAPVLNPDSGSMTVKPFIRSGTSPANNDGPEMALSQTMKAAVAIYEKEPTDDVAWTAAKINAAEAGLKVES